MLADVLGGSEVIEDWKSMGRDVGEARRLIEDTTTSDDRLRRIASTSSCWTSRRASGKTPTQRGSAPAAGRANYARSADSSPRYPKPGSGASEFVHDQYELSKKAELSEIRRRSPTMATTNGSSSIESSSTSALLQAATLAGRSAPERCCGGGGAPPRGGSSAVRSHT